MHDRTYLLRDPCIVPRLRRVRDVEVVRVAKGNAEICETLQIDVIELPGTDLPALGQQEIDIVRPRKIDTFPRQQSLQVLLGRLLSVKANGRCICLWVSLNEAVDHSEILIRSKQLLLDIVPQIVIHSGTPS